VTARKGASGVAGRVGVRPDVPVAVPPQVSTATVGLPTVGPSRPRALLIAALLLAAVWWVVLGTLAALTANPVTLNREQLLRAEFIVTGKVVGNPSDGELAVERDWTHHSLSGTVHVINLADVKPRAGVDYLIPLSKGTHGFHVTATPIPDRPPLVYAATPEAIGQLKGILAVKESPGAVDKSRL
jgi:hypothetical protein